MEFDPLSRDLAPPRYEIESGSEDDDDECGHKEAVQAQLPITIQSSSGSASRGSEAVILIQQAGLACLDKSAIPPEDSSILIDGQKQASIAAARAGKSVVFVSPTPQLLPQSRYHELAQLVLDHLAPSSVVIVDSYSPSQNLSLSRPEGQMGKLRYLADPSFPQDRIDSSIMDPLTSPESVTGLGAAFLSAAMIREAPAFLALIEDAQFQSHVQLYGSIGDSSVRMSRESAHAIQNLISPSSLAPSTSTDTSIVAFTKRSARSLPSSNQSLGDGNMYI